MRLFPYIILAYVALGMQSGLATLLDFGGSGPNFVLLAVIFIAVQAPREAALLGCFGLGLMQDILTVQPLGLFGLAYGIVAMLITASQSAVQRDNPLSHMLLALIGGAITAVLVLVNQHFVTESVTVSEELTLPAIRVGAGTLFWGVLWTTLLAPLVLWPLQKFRRTFAFDHSRRRQW